MNYCLVGGEVIGRVAVSVDGTWQKRGHFSKTGVVFVISIRTGEVLDYELKTLHCRDDDTISTAHIKWENEHKDNCDINHSGSSDKMETNGTMDIFLCSMEKTKLKYVTFVGDGDSASVASVALINMVVHM